MAGRVKRVDRAACVAWGRAASSSVVATATVAGALSADFSTNAHLELFKLDLASPALDATPNRIAVAELSERAQALAWGEPGIAVALGERIEVWESSGLKAPVATLKKHTGAVQSVDFNPLMPHLLASAGVDADLLVWDLSRPSAPTFVAASGAKASGEAISCVAWNRQVEPIIAIATANGATVWNMKENRTLLSVNDVKRKHRVRALAWSPAESLHLVTASEDDSYPVLALWDLRQAMAPVRYLEGHSRGIWSLSWSNHDPSLLLSTAKDGRTLCWHVNSGVSVPVAETAGGWAFGVHWSPALPGLFATSSLQSAVEVHALLHSPAPAIASSSSSASTSPFDQLAPRRTAPSIALPPPRWLARGCGVAQGFGGRLVSWHGRQVRTTRLAAPAALVQRSDALQTALSSKALEAFTDSMAAHDEQWRYIRVLLALDSRRVLLSLLGINKANAPSPSASASSDSTPSSPATAAATDATAAAFDDATVRERLLVGDFEGAVDACVAQNRWADGLLLASCGGGPLWSATQARYLTARPSALSLLVKAITSETMEAHVDTLAPQQWKEALALLCTYARSEAFPAACQRLASRLLAAGLTTPATLASIVAGDLAGASLRWLPSSHDLDALQSLVEKVAVMKAAIGASAHPLPPPVLAAFVAYAERHAAAGRLEAAKFYVDLAQPPPSHDSPAAAAAHDLRARLNAALAPAAPIRSTAASAPGAHPIHTSAGAPFPPSVSPYSIPPRTSPSTNPNNPPALNPPNPLPLPSPSPLPVPAAKPSAHNGPYAVPASSTTSSSSVYSSSLPAPAPFPAPSPLPAPSPAGPSAARTPAALFTPGAGSGAAPQILTPALLMPSPLAPPSVHPSPAPAVSSIVPPTAAPALAPAPAPVRAAPAPPPPPSAEALAAMAQLGAYLERCKERAGADPRRMRVVEDAHKRCLQLFARLERSEVPADRVQRLLALAQALIAADAALAAQLTNELFEAIGSQYMLGIRRLLEAGF